jgi:vanillate O-demethylase ferredoxin subunit
VNIPRLSKVVEIPQNQSMLDALEAAGIEMISDCRRGECGLCAVKVLNAEGAIDHRDVFFSDEEKAANDQMCTCVSRVAGGSITIDTADRIG